MFKNILIVDDSLSARMMIRRYLEIVGCEGAEFHEVENGKVALNVLKKVDVNLIVTDMNMPVMNGGEFIQHLKASPKLNRIPIIIVSSAAKKDSNERFMKFGANYVIGKPVSPKLLHKAVSSLNEKVQEK